MQFLKFNLLVRDQRLLNNRISDFVKCETTTSHVWNSPTWYTHGVGGTDIVQNCCTVQYQYQNDTSLVLLVYVLYMEGLSVQGLVWIFIFYLLMEWWYTMVNCSLIDK